jgi:hypothetical protein
VNLFVTDLDPLCAARDLDDTRLRKMILETAQILCTHGHTTGTPMPYKPTHTHHPVVLALSNPDNYAWTVAYFHALHTEYQFRFGKSHASYVTVRPHVPDTAQPSRIPHFANCARNASLGLNFSDVPVPTSYRRYLCARWAMDPRSPKWTNRTRPDWHRHIPTEVF